MTRGHNIVADWWAEASNPHPHPHPPRRHSHTRRQSQQQHQTCAFSEFSTRSLWTNGRTDRRTDLQTNRPTDGWTDGRTDKAPMELRVPDGKENEKVRRRERGIKKNKAKASVGRHYCLCFGGLKYISKKNNASLSFSLSSLL